MKKIVTIFILLVTISSVFAQKNYPILTLDECGATTLIYDEPIMAVVEILMMFLIWLFTILKKRR